MNKFLFLTFSLFQAYGTAFLHRVKHKHAMAKNYFFHLPSVTANQHQADLRPTSNSTMSQSSAVHSLSGQSRRVAQSSA